MHGMAARRRKKRRAWPKLAAAVLVAAAGYAAWEAATWPDVAALRRRNPSTTAFIDAWKTARRAEGLPDAPEWRWVPYASISPHLKRAVLVGEDVNFFGHHGFEIEEMKKALEEAWTEKELPRGASTITQQLAKNLWLSRSYNPLRKLKEAWLTRQLERSLDKRRILEIYLNVVEFGPGVYGAEAASRRYFGKPASALDETEAARLAAGLPSPRSWNPAAGSAAASRRAQKLLRRMESASFLWREI